MFYDFLGSDLDPQHCLLYNICKLTATNKHFEETCVQNEVPDQQWQATKINISLFIPNLFVCNSVQDCNIEEYILYWTLITKTSRVKNTNKKMAWHQTNCQSTVMFVTTRVHVFLKSYNFRSNFEHSNLIIRTNMYTKIWGFY